MRVQSLTISNFRNLVALVIEPAPGVNVFHGNNGSGKTNLLEAIFTLCLGRSQRAASDTVLVNTEAEVYRLQGQLETKSGLAEIAVAYQRGGRKKISVDQVIIRASELYEQVCLVAAGPEDSEILSGSPSARRLFLDLYISQLSHTYLADLSDYQKALSQKNAALRNEMDPTPFDPLVVSYGAKIILARARFLADLAVESARFYGEIAGGEKLRIRYQPKVQFEPGADDLSAITAAFEDAINRNRERERIMQTSMVGPHRDEVEFEIRDLPARTHGSQGQCRSAAVALKLAVFELLKKKRNTAPILLLDEIFAELDDQRAESLATKFYETGQLFLTTAVAPPAVLMDNARQFEIADGAVVEVS
jgi:DNA replication and repair protein RecF